MNPKRYLENHIRGWLPKEPSLPCNQRAKIVELSKEEIQKKNFKNTSIANLFIFVIFQTLHVLIDPYNRNVEYMVIHWIFFVLSLVSVNLLLYRHYTKKTSIWKLKQ